MSSARPILQRRHTMMFTMLTTLVVAGHSFETAYTQGALVLPEEVAEFQLTSTKRFEDPAAGSLFMYENENAVSPISVYVYPASQLVSQEEASTESDALSLEVKSFIESLPIGQARGWYDAYRVAYENPTEVEVDGRVASGHTVGVVLRKGRKAQVSLYYVFLLHGQFVKVRSTMSAEGFSDTTVPRFVNLLIAQLATS